MILIVDRGNTREKFRLVDNNGDMSHPIEYDDVANRTDIERVIYCSVRDAASDVAFCQQFQQKGIPCESFKQIHSRMKDNKQTEHMFVESRYQNLDLLGEDRLASMYWAKEIYKSNVLLIDAGTCITYDYLNQDAVHQGGIISCGLQMRYQAMHNYTANLPLQDELKKAELCATNTKDCICSGVINGTVFEVQGLINSFQKENKDIKVIITGGDGLFLKQYLNKQIQYKEDIVLEALRLMAQAETDKTEIKCKRD